MSKLLAMLLVVASCVILVEPTSPSAGEAPETGISVQLIQPERAFPTKGPIMLRVEVANLTNSTLLVCRDLGFTSDSCEWQFEVRDRSGHRLPGFGIVSDRGEGPPDPFPNVLISNWIALGPRYTYGTSIDLVGMFGLSTRPGRYRVKATLSSGGPGEASTKNDLVRYPKELAALPYAGWKGRAESNWVSIEIPAR